MGETTMRPVRRTVCSTQSPFLFGAAISSMLPAVAASLLRTYATPRGGRDRATSPSAIGRLTARPLPQLRDPRKQSGVHPLGLDEGRDALVYIPADYTPQRPAPLVLLLHGAGGSAPSGLGLLQSLADAANLILLAPDSKASTWDVLVGGF